MEYKKGCIVLSNTKGEFIGSAIRFISKSKFSHSFVTMPPILEIPMCAEDSSLGVDMLRFDTGYLQDTNESIEVWEVNIPDDAKDAGLLAVLNELEQGYGYSEFPWFIWRWLNGIFGRDIKAQDNWSQKNSVCSGLVRDRYIANSGLSNLFDGFGRNSVWPEDISQIMRSRPDLFTLVFSNF
jgi:hypothetical protein